MAWWGKASALWTGLHKLTADSATIGSSLTTYLTLSPPNAGTYRFKVLAAWNKSDTTGASVSAHIGQTNMTANVYTARIQNSAADTAGTPGFADITAAGTTSFAGGDLNAGGQTTTGQRGSFYEGVFTLSAGGVFIFQMSASAGTQVVKAGSYLLIEQIS